MWLLGPIVVEGGGIAAFARRKSGLPGADRLFPSRRNQRSVSRASGALEDDKLHTRPVSKTKIAWFRFGGQLRPERRLRVEHFFQTPACQIAGGDAHADRLPRLAESFDNHVSVEQGFRASRFP